MARIQRCGKNCHEAKHDKCVCWCGGLFHDKKGRENRKRMSEFVQEQFPEAKLDEDGYYMVEETDQLKLF